MAKSWIHTRDRPGNAFATESYAGTTKTPTLVGAEAGLGHARAEWGVFDAEAKGPNVGAGAEASAVCAKAFAKAELASASATAGPVKATVGLSADTGAGIGVEGLDVKVLGTGFKVGRTMGISLFGTGFEFKLW